MIVLAQSDSGDIGGFMQQSFVGPVLTMLCVVGVLLLAVIATLVYLRRRKAMENRANTPSTPSFYGDTGGHDMPDLDILVNTAGLSQPIPAASQPPPARAARKGTFVVAVNDGDATEAVEIMTILRDVVDGRLIVQMGDKAYQSVNNDPDFKERFNKVMRELAQVVAKPTASSTPEPTAPAETITESQAEAVENTEPEAKPPSLADLMQPTVDPSPTPKLRPAMPPPPTASGAMPGDLPSFKLADNPYEPPKRGQKKDIKPVPELNIAGAIEAYLQYKLQHTPAYHGRSIHIYPSPDGGVSIEVDGRYHDAVGDIQDTEIREFIAMAIAEWQERH
jgi:hypothetical protein